MRFSKGEMQARAIAAMPDMQTKTMKKSWREMMGMKPNSILDVPSG